MAHVLGRAKKSGSGFVCSCLCHDDQHASLSITERDGKLLFKCHAGCGQRDLADEFRRGWLNGADPEKKPKRRIVATFPYVDEAGDLLYEVVRFEPKGSVNAARTERANLGDARRVLYRLPELLEDLAAERTIFIVEGERKVDLLRRWNLAATCNGMGAAIGKEAHKWRPEFSECLKGADAVLLPDNVETGREHVKTVAASLAAVNARVRVLDLPGLGPKGDVVNWAAAGGTADQLLALVEKDARPWRNGKTEPFETAEMQAGEMRPDDVAPKAILVGLDEIEPEPVSWIWKYFIALGKFHIIAGAPGDGKTTIVLSFIAAISSGGMFPDGTKAPVGNCIIWTNEDGVADTIKPRLIRIGADMKRIKIVRGQRDKNGKVRPFNPATDMPSLIEAAKELDGGVVFLMLDPVLAAVPTSRNSDKNAETRAGLAPVVGFAEALNAAAFGISHVSKGTVGKEPLERVTGSLAYGAVPRIVYLTAKKLNRRRQRA